MSKHDAYTPGLLHSSQTREVRGYPQSRFEGLINVGESGNYGNCIAIVHMGGPGGINSGPEAVQANARRIVACWNYCAGISTAELEQRAAQAAQGGEHG